MKWVGLPYPVSNLKGDLELHPDNWVFKNMRGTNGQAVISDSGELNSLPQPAQGGPPRQGREPAVRQPVAASVTAGLAEDHGHDRPVRLVRRGRDDPGRPGSRTLPPGDRPRDLGHQAPLPADAAAESRPGRDDRDADGGRQGPIRLRQRHREDARRRLQVPRCPGQVRPRHGHVKTTASSKLEVYDLRAQDFRLDSRLRDKMPPVMADFARRLDEGKTFRVNGNLKLSWSGKLGEPPRCKWDHALVVFNDNTIQAGLPLEHMQGQLANVWGESDGGNLEVHGALDLCSVSLHGQQVTQLESPLDVKDGVAPLSNIRGRLLGGEIVGGFQVSLDRRLATTPRWSRRRRPTELCAVARRPPAVQGSGLRQAQPERPGQRPAGPPGRGRVQITRGDLGELPGYLALLKLLSLSPATKTWFDSADVAFRIENGKTFVDPIRVTGDVISFHGRGTLDVQGDLDLRLNVLWAATGSTCSWSAMPWRGERPVLPGPRPGHPGLPQAEPRTVPLATDTFSTMSSRGATADAVT